MIKDEIVKIKISNKTISYYRGFYANINIGDIFEISSLNLQKGSSIKITGICDYCGIERKISKKSYNLQTNYNKEKFTCSKKCSLIKAKQTNIDKYGVDNPFKSEEIKNKIKQTNSNRYGVDNPQKNNKIREKTKVTNLGKYGFEVPSMSSVIKDRIKKTNNSKFGVDYPAQSEYIKNKMILSCYEKYGVDNFSKTKKFTDSLNEKAFSKMVGKLEKHGELLKSYKSEYQIKCSQCSNEFTILHTLMYNRMVNGDTICTYCNPKKQLIKEKELYNFIRDNYNSDIIKNYRKLISKEIDIYLPHLNIAFEFNGLYWHSELHKKRNYHLSKTNNCRNKGVQLIHIWEDDWNYKKNIIKSIIINKLGKSKTIYARKTSIMEITDNALVSVFLTENHLQGFIGSFVKLGLFYEGELVSIMTFGRLRKSLGQRSKEDTYELLRFCNKLNTNVVGGASKLLKYFEMKYKPIEIISYSDNSRSNGDLYEKIGFKLSHDTVPNYYWVIDGIRKHRFNYRKDKLVKEGHDINKTEIEIMSELGYYRIFDSGSKKWIK